jgi:glycosyltransferase involved in cell wall biosynthesis
LVSVNARFLGQPLTSGVERYGREITARLGGRVTLLKPRRLASGLPGHVWEQIVLPRLLKPKDVLWSPANTGPWTVRNHVVTIHDLSPIEHPEWYTRGFVRWYKVLLPRLAQRCRRLITDSMFSKARLLERFALPQEKVVVVPLGVDTVAFQPVADAHGKRVREKYRLPTRYLLAIGPPGPRKNLEAMLQAWQRMHPRFPDVHLVLAGGGVRNFRSLSSRELPRGVRFIGWVDDGDLSAVYAGATIFLLTSLYEGFGLSILEAMACGVPVVASDRAAIPEVVGDAGLLVAPNEPEAIATAVIRLLEDDRLRSDLRERGSKRARDFSWERATERTWQVLQQAAA